MHVSHSLLFPTSGQFFLTCGGVVDIKIAFFAATPPLRKMVSRKSGEKRRRMDVRIKTTSIGCSMPLTGEYEPGTANWAREQVELYESSGGTKGTTLRGLPVIVLSTIGARSGKLRKTPLMRVEHDGEYAVVASLGGAPKHPVWYYNLLAESHVELQDAEVKRDYSAREVHGAEKAEWWKRAVAAYPPYADYQNKTEREIPVFVLTPMTS
jgi:deazaflavin-dependent oxidoreductase (nitroreductase family)